MNPAAIDFKGLSIDRLKAFCAVVELGSVIRAADGDPNRQSQISRQIKELEDALEVRLFERKNRRLVPTTRGRELAMLTTVYFASIAEITQQDHERSSRLSIAAGESVFNGFIIPRFALMREALPECRFAFHQCSTEEALRRVGSGDCDLAVVRDTANLEGMQVTSLGIAQYRLAVPRRLLPEGQKGGFQKLKGLPVAMLSGGGEFNRRLKQVFVDSGSEMDVVAESDTFANLRDLVQTGFATAILPEWSAKTLPTESTAVVALPELKILERNLVIASHGRINQMRPRVAEAIASLREVWRP